jgi:hypothetical protein
MVYGMGKWENGKLYANVLDTRIEPLKRTLDFLRG